MARDEAATDTSTDSASDDGAAPGRDPDKAMTDSQRTYLEPPAESQDEEFRDDMSEADAAATIDRLQEQAVHVY